MLDDPFTVTIKGRDTGNKQNDDLWDTPKVLKYYKGDKVTLIAPVESDEIFEKWINAEGITIDDPTKESQTIESMSGNVILTAVYNPVVKEIDVTITEPSAGNALASRISDASIKVTNTYSGYGKIL